MKPKIVKMGDAAWGVKITGEKKNLEKATFIVSFPGGYIELSRTSQNNYWLHVGVHHEENGLFIPKEDQAARITKAKMSIHGKHSSKVNLGDFNHDGLYDVALHIERH